MKDQFNQNNLQSASNGIKQTSLNSKCASHSRATNSNQKCEGNNQWDSVPMTYDKDESTHKNEKSETNNQWTSTSK